MSLVGRFSRKPVRKRGASWESLFNSHELVHCGDSRGVAESHVLVSCHPLQEVHELRGEADKEKVNKEISARKTAFFTVNKEISAQCADS